MSDEASDAIGYANLIQVEIETEAEKRRRSDPELLRLEQEIETAWGHVAPSAAGTGQERLLDRVDQLSLVNVDAPTGNRRGARQVKALIRKLTRWYLQHVVDQLNAFHHFQGRLLRGMDKRLTRLENDSLLHGTVSEFLDPLPEADPGLAKAVAQCLMSVDGPVAVVSCGGGAIVAALGDAGISAHGVDETAATIMPSVTAGLDLRVGSPLQHLNAFADTTLAAVVLTRVIERRRIVDLLALIDEALRCLAASGKIVVAVADPSTRTAPEAELLCGYGLSPETWVHLLSKRGCAIETVAITGSRVKTLVVAQRS